MRFKAPKLLYLFISYIAIAQRRVDFFFTCHAPDILEPITAASQAWWLIKNKPGLGPSSIYIRLVWKYLLIYVVRDNLRGQFWRYKRRANQMRLLSRLKEFLCCYTVHLRYFIRPVSGFREFVLSFLFIMYTSSLRDDSYLIIGENRKFLFIWISKRQKHLITTQMTYTNFYWLSRKTIGILQCSYHFCLVADFATQIASQLASQTAM